jgi:hypothetical protein
MVVMPWLPRIRQAVLVTHTLEPVVARVREHFGRWVTVPEPYRDPGVGRFGLENAVLAIGDSFLEILAPVRAETAAGRHLQRRGGDAGYMVMLQVADMAATRERLAALAVRVVWEVELEDAVDLHLHPHDVPGALVAVDTMDPPGSWRWGGPAFTGTEVAATGGLLGLTLAVPDPLATARRWAAVAGCPEPTDATLSLGRQWARFTSEGRANGLISIAWALPGVPERVDDLQVGDTSIEIHPLIEETVDG